MYSRKIKYPRTPHLPWSPGFTHDDVRNKTVNQFNGKHVVVTEKMDGENTTMYANCIHARSVDSRHHASRDWVKALHARVGHGIPKGWRLCGENVFAKHSIYYEQLSSYFFMFSMWDEGNTCLHWDETKEWAELLGLCMPKELYIGKWDSQWFKDHDVDMAVSEGYVVRLVDSFDFGMFDRSVAKWVRPSHVSTDKHWMHAEVVPNKLGRRDKGENK